MSRYEDGYPPRGSNSDYYVYSSGVRAAAEAPSSNPRQLRLTYKPEGTSYSPYSQPEICQVPRSHSQMGSLPSPIKSPRDRNRERGYYRDSDRDASEDDTARSPVEKAKRFLDGIFTDSMTGLGVGVLGALVGGLAGREAVNLTSKRQHHGENQGDDSEHKRNQLIGTMVGATVGALGANAVEKRIEVSRAEQERRERRWRESADGDVVRSRSKRRSHHSHHREEWDVCEDLDQGGSGGNGHGTEREVDRGSRSWKTVEDWVLDGANGSEHDHDCDRDRSDRPRLGEQRSHRS